MVNIRHPFNEFEMYTIYMFSMAWLRLSELAGRRRLATLPQDLIKPPVQKFWTAWRGCIAPKQLHVQAMRPLPDT